MLLDGKSIACAFCEAKERIEKLEDELRLEHNCTSRTVRGYMRQSDKCEELEKEVTELRRHLATEQAVTKMESVACVSYATRINKLRAVLESLQRSHCVVAGLALQSDNDDAKAYERLRTTGSVMEGPGAKV